MRAYFYLVPLFLVLACSEREDSENMRVLVPWPTESGQHKLQIIEINTLNDMRKMQGDAAQLYVNPTVSDAGTEGEVANAQFSKSSKGYYVPKDTLTQEMVTIYAHMEKLKELDDQTGVSKLISWPRQIGIETLAIDANTNRQITENAMYVTGSDIMLFFPYSKNILPVSLNAGVIAHEHFHAIFQRVVVDALSEKFDVGTFGGDNENRELTEEEVEKREIAKNNRFVLRAINEGLADTWGSIYLGRLEFLTQSLDRHPNSRNANPELLTIRPLQDLVPRVFGAVNENLLEGLTYNLGTQYARAVRRNLDENKFDLKDKTAQAKWITQKLKRLRELLIENYGAKLPADILLQALYTKEELNAENCEWMSPILNSMGSDYKVACREIVRP